MGSAAGSRFKELIIYTLRNYQQEAVDAAIECLTAKKQKNGILVLPTGSGKSIIVAKLVEVLGGKTIILQPTKEILEQNLEKLIAIGCKNVGVYSASMNKKYVGSITLATIGSVVNKISLFSEFDRIIIDECHKVNAKGGMYEKFINKLDIPVLGLTATPYRMRSYRHFKTGQPIAESRIITRTRPRIFSKIAHVTQIQELFDAGFLCPMEYECDADYNPSLITMTTTGMGFNPAALAKYNKNMNITEKTFLSVMQAKRKSNLIFTEFTSESKEVIELFAKEGIKCCEVSAETKPKDRERIIRNFKAGTISHVINVGTLTTGFDYPELACVCMSSPGMSVALYYQKAGRGIRIAEGKDSCLLIDLCGNVKRFGKIETFELYDQNGKGMWRLKSSAGNLTGTDVITGKNLEKVKPAYKGPEKSESGLQLITFGKYSGTPVKELSDDYLKWCAENFDSGKWKKIFRTELVSRDIEIEHTIPF